MRALLTCALLALALTEGATDEGATNKGATDAAADPSLVTVTQGQLRGVKEQSAGARPFYAFRSIPFAEPPVGELRLEPPVKAAGWEGVREVQGEAPKCLQPNMESLFGGPPGIVGAEDCLYLNVFSPMPERTPGDKHLLPVFVYIHGGGYMCGSAEDAQPYLMMDQEVVLVAIQYRLGTLGFLSTEDDVAPGNMGMLDQTLALEWVQKNIVNFGGDPLKVTIAGTSAGSTSVHLQVLSHTSLGYFQRAVMMSGTALDSWAVVQDHRFHAYEIAKVLDCKAVLEKEAKLEIPEKCNEFEADSVELKSCVIDELPSEQILKCMKMASSDDLTELQFMFKKLHFMPLVMAPRVDKNFLMKDPAVLIKENRVKKVDMIFGFTTHDGVCTLLPIYSNEAMRSAMKYNFEEVGVYSIMMDPKEIAALNQTIMLYDHYVGNINFELEDKDNLIKLFTDADFWHTTDMCAAKHSEDRKAQEKGKKVFMYEWAYRGSFSFTNFFAAGEIGEGWAAHADDMFYLFGAPKGFDFPKTDEEKAMSRNLIEFMTTFAYTGTPSLEGVSWDAYQSSAPNVLVMDGLRPATAHIKAEERKLWRSLPLKRNLILFPDSVTNLTLAAPEAAGQTKPKDEL